MARLDDIKLLSSIIKDKNRMKGQLAGINNDEVTYTKIDQFNVKLKDWNLVIVKNGTEVVRRRFEWKTTSDFTKTGTTFTGALIFTDNKIRGNTGWQ